MRENGGASTRKLARGGFVLFRVALWRFLLLAESRLLAKDISSR